MNLRANLELATATSLSLVWDMVPDSDLKTDGYMLEMLNDDDNWIPVYEARYNPNALGAIVYGLTTGKNYKFRAYAFNFNGASVSSEIFEIYACGLPKYFEAPRYVWSTQTTITIEWDTPKVDGGCPIYDY